MLYSLIWRSLSIIIYIVVTPFRCVKGHHSTDSDNTGSVSNAKYRLLSDMFEHYNRHIRPIRKVGEITNVSVELSLFNILEVVTEEEYIRTSTELKMKWLDPYLKWNPKNYENISSIIVPVDQVWSPDVILYNTADTDYKSNLLTTNAIVKHDGIVQIVTHAVLSSVCNMDVQFYPFDEQICRLKLASWTYDENEIILVNNGADISRYTENPEFYLENFYGETHLQYNPCCEYPMSSIIFKIKVHRRREYSLFNFVLPGVLINACALLVFFLPAESGEKMVLGISSMVAMIVFLMEMTLHIPPTEKLPLAGIYYGVCIVLIAANIIFSVFIMNMNASGFRQRQIPLWFRNLTLFLVSFLGNRIPEVIVEKWDLPKDNSTNQRYLRNLKTKLVRVKPSLSSLTVQNETNWNEVPARNHRFVDPFQRRMILSLEEITKAMNQKDAQLNQAEVYSVCVQEWEFISRVYDRLLFISFTVFAIIINVYLITSSPSTYDFSYCPIEIGDCSNMAEEEIKRAILNTDEND